MLATNVPVEIVMLPVLSAVAVVVPTVNLSALSSHAIIALSPVEPLSIKIPVSLAFEPAPEFNSNKLSAIVVFVEATVVVVPFTVKSPESVKLVAVIAPDAIAPVPVITGDVKVLFVKVCEAVLSVIALVLDKSVEAIVIFALPLNDCPAIVLAVSNAVAVSALPVTSPVIFDLVKCSCDSACTCNRR